MELLLHNDHRYDLARQGEAFHPKNNVKTMKYVGDSIMFRGCFAATGTDELQKIHGIIRKDYLEILKLNLKTSARRSKPGHH